MKTWTKEEWRAWLDKWHPCVEGLAWWNWRELDPIKFLQLLISDGKLDWANWAIVRMMSYKQYVAYAIYAAEQVIGIYEQKYPDDKRPRKAIGAARKCLADPSKKNKSAYAAAYAAYAADSAAYAADSAAYAADSAARAAAYAAAYAADSARTEMKKKILNYGIELLEEEKG